MIEVEIKASKMIESLEKNYNFLNKQDRQKKVVM